LPSDGKEREEAVNFYGEFLLAGAIMIITWQGVFFNSKHSLKKILGIRKIFGTTFALQKRLIISLIINKVSLKFYCLRKF
jgi:hypothetical protein